MKTLYVIVLIINLAGALSPFKNKFRELNILCFIIMVSILFIFGCKASPVTDPYKTFRGPECATYTNKSDKHYRDMSKKINPKYFCTPR
jgi:hypothetical protein